MHRNEPPREAPPGTWQKVIEFGQALFKELQLRHGPAEHVVSAGTLAAGVAFMKATGASEEEVLRIARRLYRESSFRLMS